MTEMKYDYDEGLDILHVYSSDIKKGIKGCLSIGDFSIDVGIDNDIVGIEIEEASKIFNLSPNVISSLENVSLVVKRQGNMLFMGIAERKGEMKSFIQLTTPQNKVPLQSVKS